MANSLSEEIQTEFSKDPAFGGIQSALVDHKMFGNQLVVFMYGTLNVQAVYDRDSFIVYLKDRNNNYIMLDIIISALFRWTLSKPNYSTASDLHALLLKHYAKLSKSMASGRKY